MLFWGEPGHHNVHTFYRYRNTGHLRVCLEQEAFGGWFCWVVAAPDKGKDLGEIKILTQFTLDFAMAQSMYFGTVDKIELNTNVAS